MDRIRKISQDVLQDHSSKFGTNFDENKSALESISIIRSKSLKNKIAGHITRVVKRQIREKEEKKKREEEANQKIESEPKEQIGTE